MYVIIVIISQMNLTIESIIWAPTESLNLTLALANRAFVWIKLEEHQKAEVDLEWCLSIKKYPKDTVHKIEIKPYSLRTLRLN